MQLIKFPYSKCYIELSDDASKHIGDTLHTSLEEFNEIHGVVIWWEYGADSPKALEQDPRPFTGVEIVHGGCDYTDKTSKEEVIAALEDILAMLKGNPR